MKSIYPRKNASVALFGKSVGVRKFFGIVPAVALFALAVPAAHGMTTVWAEGVSESDGWVDYNKDGNNDSQLCWAASSADIIDWWQKKASVAGVSIPTGTPTGSNIFPAFKETFGNVALGTNVGWEWYFSGYSSASKTYSGGAYWKDYVDSLNIPANGSLPGYIGFGQAYDVNEGDSNYANLVSTLTTKLEEGAGISLVIVPSNESSGHAVTLWGMEVDDGKLNKIYITDSDDGATKLAAYNVSFQTETVESGDGKETPITTWERTKIYLTNYYGGSYYISSWSSLSIAVPEPSAFGLFAGLVAIALAVAPRRRSRR